MNAIWTQYLETLKKINTNFPIELNDGIEQSYFDAMVNKMSIDLPDELRDLLSICNGQKPNAKPILFGFRLLSIEEIKEQIDLLLTEKETVSIPFAKWNKDDDLETLFVNSDLSIESNKSSFDTPLIIANSLSDLLMLLIDHIEFDFYHYSKDTNDIAIFKGERMSKSLHKEYIEQLVKSTNSELFYQHQSIGLIFQLSKNYVLMEDTENTAKSIFSKNAIHFIDNSNDAKNTFVYENEEETTTISMGLNRKEKEIDDNETAQNILDNFQKQAKVYEEMNGFPLKMESNIIEEYRGFDLFLKLKYGMHETENTFLYFFFPNYILHIMADHQVKDTDLNTIIETIKLAN